MMKALKTHLSLILPLLFMMFAFEFVLIINETVKHYEGRVNENYNIIIASSKELNVASLKLEIPNLNSLQSVDAKDLLKRLKDNISANNLAALEKNLPKFYKLTLNHFPTQAQLNEIKNKLLKISGVHRVEVFLKTYDQIDNLFTLIKFVLWFFLFIIILLSFVLFLKQMRIWLFEHTERVEIMCLFGASFWFRSLMLYRIVFIDCFIAFVLLLIFFTQVYSLEFIQESLKLINISLPKINFFIHLGIVFLVSLAVSLLCVNSVMFKVKR